VLKSILLKLFPHLAAPAAPLRADGKMHLFEGRRGRGKTYTMTALTKQFISEKRRVYTNVRSLDYYRMAVQLTQEKHFPSLVAALRFMAENVKFVRTWNDVVEAFDGVLMLDEASRMFHSHRGQGLQVPAIVYEWFRQSRHFKMTIILATQDFNWIDNKLASLVDVFWLVKKEVDKEGNPVRFWLYGQDSGGAGSFRDIERRKPDRKASYPALSRIYPLYDTHEVVEDISPACSYSNMQDISRYYRAMGYIKPREPEMVLADALQRLTSDPDAVAVDDW